MKGFLLFILSLLLLVPLFIPLAIYTAISYAIKGKFKDLNKWFFILAISIDQLGNVASSELFNAIMIKNYSIHRFGNEDETISSVLGKNKRGLSLKFTGKLLVLLLSAFEEDHSIKSIEDDEN